MIAKLFGWRGFAVLALLLVVQSVRLSMANNALLDTRGKLVKAVADWAAWRDAVVNPKTGWSAAYKRLETARKADAVQCAANLASASSKQSEAVSSAFDHAYAAGRVAGRKTCGVPDAKATPAAPGAAAGGLRPRPEDDFARRWGASAYRPR